MGLENIYEALALREGIKRRLTAPEIGEALKSGKDPIAEAAFRAVFCIFRSSYWRFLFCRLSLAVGVLYCGWYLSLVIE